MCLKPSDRKVCQRMFDKKLSKMLNESYTIFWIFTVSTMEKAFILKGSKLNLFWVLENDGCKVKASAFKIP
jgi:hypothetical protein